METADMSVDSFSLPLNISRECHDALAESMSEIRTTFSRATSSLTESINELRSHCSEISLSFEKTFERLPARVRTAVSTLASHGWFPDYRLDISDLWRAADNFQSGNIDEANQIFMQYYTSNLAEVESRVYTRLPERVHLISSAFRAHRRAEYALSVPLLLAQADGVCAELTGHELYRRRAGAPMLAAYIAALPAGSITELLLTPFRGILPLYMNDGERGPMFQGLNRHQILHGADLLYASRLNSLKAISLLVFLIETLNSQRPETEITGEL